MQYSPIPDVQQAIEVRASLYEYSVILIMQSSPWFQPAERALWVLHQHRLSADVAPYTKKV